MKPRAAEPDKQTPEGQDHERRSPVTRLLVAAVARVAAEYKAHGRVAEPEVDEAYARVARAHGEPLPLGALVLRVHHGLRQTPQRVAREPDGDDYEHDAAVRLPDNLFERAVRVCGVAVAAQRGQRGYHADDRVDDALRRVAEPRELLDPRPSLVRELFRFNAVY